jgi:hypothetical protein
LEIGDTAGLETCATMIVVPELLRKIIPKMKALLPQRRV